MWKRICEGFESEGIDYSKEYLGGLADGTWSSAISSWHMERRPLSSINTRRGCAILSIDGGWWCASGTMWTCAVAGPSTVWTEPPVSKMDRLFDSYLSLLFVLTTLFTHGRFYISSSSYDSPGFPFLPCVIHSLFASIHQASRPENSQGKKKMRKIKGEKASGDRFLYRNLGKSPVTRRCPAAESIHPLFSIYSPSLFNRQRESSHGGGCGADAAAWNDRIKVAAGKLLVKVEKRAVRKSRQSACLRNRCPLCHPHTTLAASAFFASHSLLSSW